MDKLQVTCSDRQHAVMVRDTQGRSTPFSRGRHRHYLESCGLSTGQAAAVTMRLYEHLLHRGIMEIDSSYLARLTYRYLHRDLDVEVARRYAVWVDFMRSNRPLLLLITGVPGSGKSTIAVEVANRLEIVRTQSTDMLREVMRTMIPQRLIPVLHTSSFKAWEALPAYGYQRTNSEQAVADGYLAQAEILSVGCEAVLNRALRERVSMILEGVHVHPSLVEKLPRGTDAIVVPIMLVVLKPDVLRERFNARGEEAPDRRAERYLQHFDAIWRMQTFLLDEANRWKVPVISNSDTEKAVQQVMKVVIDTLIQDLSASPGESFL